jgi:hypothetical protein
VPKPGKSPTIVLVQAILFGLLFIPVVIAVLYALAFIEWWRNGDSGTAWIYEGGGFPVIGLFAITSASYLVMRLLPCRIIGALLMVSGGASLSWMIGRMADVMPRMEKSMEIHWQRPEFVAWLLVPPWVAAITIVVVAYTLRQLCARERDHFRQDRNSAA